MTAPHDIPADPPPWWEDADDDWRIDAHLAAVRWDQPRETMEPRR